MTREQVFRIIKPATSVKALLSMSENCEQYNRDRVMTTIFNEAREYASKMVMKQIPLPPKPSDVTTDGFDIYKCPSCGGLAGSYNTEEDKIFYKYRFCPECGQRIQWLGEMDTYDITEEDGQFNSEEVDFEV